ncbi:hypothetical protein PFDG_04890 [Plasmodium falciparum Dd2]|uniref:Uncharacterized protein n=1 Tax=Plasmodium falciparum (isolate Dd2) TaxID=57267 RepID=A0A0L7M954_PLAF4|nr:hypothetical protein PFDG_04890 [Plasmodium falciparum Dd2]
MRKSENFKVLHNKTSKQYKNKQNRIKNNNNNNNNNHSSRSCSGIINSSRSRSNITPSSDDTKMIKYSLSPKKNTQAEKDKY